MTGWQPSLGANAGADGTRVRVWAPTSKRVSLVIVRDGEPDGGRPLLRAHGGYFHGRFSDMGPGDRYWFRLDDRGLFPDPASRFQPDGVHGPSMVIDPSAFRWTDDGWKGVRLEDLSIYELHAGTFSPEGTFEGARARLPYLQHLGVRALELMPIADFPGGRNWGYDGAALFAPARCYGTPDDLRRFVDAAHAAGLGVLLDVVYNHTGPDGAYLHAFSPFYFASRHHSPWGAGVNLDGEHSADVRQFLIENALSWVHEYHLDGLRLDATHAMHDDSPRHFLSELAACVRNSVEGREVLVIAEDHRNLAVMVRPEAAGGWGLDAVWADDLHHELRCHVAGDSDGYYADFDGTTEDIAATARRGWFFTGQPSEYLGEPRGTDPSGIPPERFVVCIQNHDQIGNRAHGDRIHHAIDPATYRALSVFLLTVPETPLMFMGQEWGASTPFQYFTDHHGELGRQVTEGRRREFARFTTFADPEARNLIPDPQAESTFLNSRLRWDEQDEPAHVCILALYRALLALRRDHGAFRRGAGATVDVAALDSESIAVRRSCLRCTATIVTRLGGAGSVTVPDVSFGSPERGVTALSTEDPEFSLDPAPIQWADRGTGMQVTFARPGALVFVKGEAR